MRIPIFFALVLGSATIALAQNTSVFTSTRASACRTIESNPNEAGWYVGECKGVFGFKLRLTEGDLRQSVIVVASTGKRFDLNFPQYFGSFSSIGEKVEWRTRGRVPIALIARFIVSNPEDSSKTISHLMVSKISKTAACVTDIVPPGPNQNEEARKLADAANGKPCKKTSSN